MVKLIQLSTPETEQTPMKEIDKMTRQLIEIKKILEVEKILMSEKKILTLNTLY